MRIERSNDGFSEVRTRRPGLGHWYVVSVVYIAAVGSIQSDSTIGGFRYTGWIWLALIVVGSFLLLRTKRRVRFPVGIWGIWFGFVWLSLLWAGGINQGNVQEAIQITMPLLVGVVASLYIQDDSQLRSLRHAFVPALLVMLSTFVTLGSGAGALRIAVRTMAITACLFGCMFVAAVPARRRLSVLAWAACLGLAYFSASRMATFALLLVWVVYPFQRHWVARVGMLVVMSALGMAILYSPTFQERFFGTEGGSFSKILHGDFSTAGRFEIWPFVWEEAKNHIVRGAGVGGVNHLLMETRPVWYGINKVHNDYLRIVFEQGLIGLSCFAIAITAQLYTLRRRIGYATGELRYALTGAYLGLILLVTIMITDNIIVYNTWYMNPLFAVLGAAYGVQAHRSERGDT